MGNDFSRVKQYKGVQGGVADHWTAFRSLSTEQSALNKVIIILLAVCTVRFTFAHSGGLDSRGGHTDRKTGVYHCHESPCGNNGSAAESASASSMQYSRDDWKHWSDFDNDCMNTRHEILLSQAVGEVHLSPDGCYVSSGAWLDPFTGATLHRASDLDVDHIIPLKWAHDHGGAAWSAAKKERFANDPLNLLAVDDGQNQSKGAQGPSEWLPPNQVYRCTYLLQWQQVLEQYPSLRMTPSESRVFTRQKQACGF